ncbi:MAG: cell division protein ZapA [Pseudomonadota bacterium]
MPEVSVEVAGRSYRVGCGDGEEARVAELGKRIDREAMDLSSQMGAVSETRLLLMTSLMLADKLAETEDALRGAEVRAGQAEAAASAKPSQSGMNPDREAQIAANLDALSDRIEVLVGRIRQTA